MAATTLTAASTFALLLLSGIACNTEERCEMSDAASLIQKEAYIHSFEKEAYHPGNEAKETFSTDEQIEEHVMESIRNVVNSGRTNVENKYEKLVETGAKASDDLMRLTRKMDLAKAHGMHSVEAGNAMDSVQRTVHRGTAAAAGQVVERVEMIKQAQEDPLINDKVRDAVHSVVTLNRTGEEERFTDFYYKLNVTKPDVPEYVQNNDWTLSARPEGTLRQAVTGASKDFFRATKEYNDRTYGEQSGKEIVKDIVRESGPSAEQIMAKDAMTEQHEASLIAREAHIRKVTEQLDSAIEKVGGISSMPLARTEVKEKQMQSLEQFQQDQDAVKQQAMEAMEMDASKSLADLSAELGIDADLSSEASLDEQDATKELKISDSTAEQISTGIDAEAQDSAANRQGAFAAALVTFLTLMRCS
eukprot:gnl/TRDRNA2_/TRDRNA2_166142_c2_seq3.p1 gnl/TRDRNA2_/TRDRNA2_166142_c2~~gnl/TRDRNA2_/TRDRNA2_166142_c2_seq3.p1  ORF type:complete len:418 (-),score=118.54 gnl/TRDRNA2_/TRDRNA2_166142_c2_seq3:30-1283(-)